MRTAREKATDKGSKRCIWPRLLHKQDLGWNDRLTMESAAVTPTDRRKSLRDQMHTWQGWLTLLGLHEMVGGAQHR